MQLSMRILQDGAIASIEVGEEGDSKNRDYVKRYLPAIAFPPFGNAFANQKDCSFAVTLIGGA